MKHHEFELQQQVVKYLELQYPDVNFESTGTPYGLSKTQAGRNKSIQKNGFKTPDLIILEPNKKYHGLCIELKVVSPYKKDGGLKKSDHLQGQKNSIDELLTKGYLATFSVGFDETKKIIDKYMSER